MEVDQLNQLGRTLQEVSQSLRELGGGLRDIGLALRDLAPVVPPAPTMQHRQSGKKMENTDPTSPKMSKEVSNHPFPNKIYMT